MCWYPSSRKTFAVNSFYKVLHSGSAQHFPWRTIWKSLAPSKVSFFLWTSALGKVLTTDNIRKRGLIVIDWCCMCKWDGETIDHFLIHCPIA